MEIGLKERVENTIISIMIEGGREILETIVRLEMDDLVLIDPSFGEIAKQAKALLLHVSEAIHQHQEPVLKKLLDSYKEYIEILEHLADCVGDRDIGRLVDCITHLTEFLEINK